MLQLLPMALIFIWDLSFSVTEKKLGSVSLHPVPRFAQRNRVAGCRVIV